MTEQPQENKLEHPCFPQPTDGSVRVWRYLDLAKFIWLLENQKLYMSRLDLLNDPHEGSTPKFLAEQWNQELFQSIAGSRQKSLLQEFGDALGNEKFLAEIPRIIQQHDQMSSINQKMRKHFYVNCWHLGNSESEAMWRLYCPGNSGVAIQTSYNKLVASVENHSSLFIGKVSYIDYEFQGFPQGNILYPVMHKRISFAHEQEVRLVTTKFPENWGTPQEEVNPLGVLFDWPLDMVVEAIHVDPYAPVYFHDVVSSVIRRVLPDLEDRVFWSKMRASPVY